MARDLVAGLPQWVSLRLRNESDSTTFSRQRCVSFAERTRALSVTAVRGADVVASVSAANSADIHGTRFIEALWPSNERTFLLDLHGVLPLGPGAYRLTFDYADARASASTSVTLDEPTDGEAKAISARDDDGWLATVLRQPTGVAAGPDASSVRAHEHLRLYGVLQSLLWADDWGGVEPTILDGFVGLLEGPAAALRYELAALGGPPVPDSTRAGLVARWPGLDWWVELADNRNGPLASLRERRAGGELPSAEPIR